MGRASADRSQLTKTKLSTEGPVPALDLCHSIGDQNGQLEPESAIGLGRSAFWSLRAIVSATSRQSAANIFNCSLLPRAGKLPSSALPG
jgi:hypothetical protein